MKVYNNRNLEYTIQARETLRFVSMHRLSNQIRLLWQQNVYWTRMLIISIVFELPNLEFVTNRLLRNPQDFAEALNLFYEEDVVSEFTKLFTQHITIAEEFVKAAKNGDNAEIAAAEKQWYENADELAKFFRRINLFWPEEEWRKMLYDNITMTKNEVFYILNQEYENSINIFDAIEQQALIMADTMTEGLIEFFPNILDKI